MRPIKLLENDFAREAEMKSSKPLLDLAGEREQKNILNQGGDRTWRD
jgi:hypothetical protein